MSSKGTISNTVNWNSKHYSAGGLVGWWERLDFASSSTRCIHMSGSWLVVTWGDGHNLLYMPCHLASYSGHFPCRRQGSKRENKEPRASWGTDSEQHRSLLFSLLSINASNKLHPDSKGGEIGPHPLGELQGDISKGMDTKKVGNWRDFCNQYTTPYVNRK